MPVDELEDLPVRRGEGGDGVPGDRAEPGLVGAVLGDGRGGGAAAQALAAGERVQPDLEPRRVGERVDPRLGRDHRVAEGHLRAVRAAGERPAVAVDAFGVPVVQLGESVGVAGTERVDQTAVIHVTDSNKW